METLIGAPNLNCRMTTVRTIIETARPADVGTGHQVPGPGAERIEIAGVVCQGAQRDSTRLRARRFET